MSSSSPKRKRDARNTRRRHKRQIKGYGDSTNLHSKTAQKFFARDARAAALLGPSHQIWMVASAQKRRDAIRRNVPKSLASRRAKAAKLQRRLDWFAQGGHHGKAT